MTEADYNLSAKHYIVTTGHAPLPSTVLSPKRMFPLNSKASLLNYIRENGTMNESANETRSEADVEFETYRPPEHCLWLKRLVVKGKPGVPDRELGYKDGIRT